MLLLIGLGALLFHCRRTTGSESTAPMEVPEGYQAFAEFYQRFHEDSLYQMEHIIFPIQGLPPKVDSATLARNDFRWHKEDWKMHRPIEVDDFNRTFIPYGEDLIVERIIHETGEYGMLRRWAEINGEWYLIYYVAMNRLKQESDGSFKIEGGF
jgi:hypothetical protein